MALRISRRMLLTIFPFVLPLACRSSQPTTEEEPVSVVTAPASDERPKVSTKTIVRPQPDAAVAAPSVTRNIECMGGERRLTYLRRVETKSTSEVELKFSAAGHRAWSYRFHYFDGSLQRIEHRVASWHFSDDPSGEPSTRDTVLERRYRVADGKAINCVAARASGPTATIESQLSEVSTTAIDCSDAERLLALASRLDLATRVPEKPSLATACAAADPSSGMKL